MLERNAFGGVSTVLYFSLVLLTVKLLLILILFINSAYSDVSDRSK